MNRRLLLVLAIGLAGLAGIGLRGADTPKQEEPDDFVASSNTESPPEGSSPQLHSGATASPRAPQQTAHDELQRDFDELMECMTYRRFSTLFELQKNNPDFPLNNEEALLAMPRAEQNLLMERVHAVRDNSEKCETWSHSVDDETAVYMIYQSAFSAAERGDLKAGVCYAMAPWGFPDSPPVQSVALKRQYITHAKKFIDRGIQGGSWPAVISANNIVNAEHGPSAAVDWPQMQTYVFARLLQLGAPDQELSSAYGFEAARRAETLSAESLVAGDKMAVDLFRSRFSGRIMTDEDRYENCGN